MASSKQSFQQCLQFYAQLRNDNLKTTEVQMCQSLQSIQSKILEVTCFRKDLQKVLEINVLLSEQGQTIDRLLTRILQLQNSVIQLTQKLADCENIKITRICENPIDENIIINQENKNKFQQIMEEVMALRLSVEDLEPVINIIHEQNHQQQQIIRQRQNQLNLQAINKVRNQQFQLRKQFSQNINKLNQIIMAENRALINQLLQKPYKNQSIKYVQIYDASACINNSSVYQKQILNLSRTIDKLNIELVQLKDTRKKDIDENEIKDKNIKQILMNKQQQFQNLKKQITLMQNQKVKMKKNQQALLKQNQKIISKINEEHKIQAQELNKRINLLEKEMVQSKSQLENNLKNYTENINKIKTQNQIIVQRLSMEQKKISKLSIQIEQKNRTIQIISRQKNKQLQQLNQKFNQQIAHYKNTIQNLRQKLTQCQISQINQKQQLKVYQHIQLKEKQANAKVCLTLKENDKITKELQQFKAKALELQIAYEKIKEDLSNLKAENEIDEKQMNFLTQKLDQSIKDHWNKSLVKVDDIISRISSFI